MAVITSKAAEGYRTFYKDISTSGVVLAAGAGAAAVVVGVASYTIFVQRIIISITTAAAQTITVRDNAGTPINILLIAASATGVIAVDFGARGFALTEGQQLDIAGTAGPAYAYSVEGYLKQTSAIAATTATRTV